MQVDNKLFFAEVERVIAAGEQVRFHVKGYSMRPLLRDRRDTVVLAPCHPEKLKINDIILFRYRGHHILHRIVHIDGECFTLEGDGNYRKQETCRPSDIVAIMRCVIRANGHTIDCTSSSWKLRSGAWLSLPPIIRRYTLGILFRLGYK